MYMNIPIFIYVYIYSAYMSLRIYVFVCECPSQTSTHNRRVLNPQSVQPGTSMIGGANSSRLKPFRFVSNVKCVARGLVCSCVCYYNNTTRRYT